MAEGDQAPMIPRGPADAVAGKLYRLDLLRSRSEEITETAVPPSSSESTPSRSRICTSRMSATGEQPSHGYLLVRLTDKTQRGLLLIADRTFELNASNYPLESMDSGDTIDNGARVPKDQSPPPHRPSAGKMVDLFIDYRMMGVGGDDSWGATAHEPYLIRPGKENAIEYGFSLVPFDKKEDYKYLIRQY